MERVQGRWLVKFDDYFFRVIRSGDRLLVHGGEPRDYIATVLPTLTPETCPVCEPMTYLFGDLASYELRTAPDDHKIFICPIPPGNPDNRREILVDFHAVPAPHGDTQGSCNSDIDPVPQ